jgi:hypothetical protein
MRPSLTPSLLEMPHGLLQRAVDIQAGIPNKIELLTRKEVQLPALQILIDGGGKSLAEFVQR